MATSGSTNFADSTEAIIKDALIYIGAGAPGESPDPDSYEYAERTLNRMIKAWQSKGYNLFRTKEGSITLVANQQSYTMGGTAPDFAERPLRIESVRFKDSSGTETPIVTEMSREEYFELPNKDSSGTTTNFYYDPQYPQGVLYVWPVLSSATTETLEFTYQRPFEDFDSNADEPDFPQEWFRALVSNLGADLHPAFYPSNPEKTAFLRSQAQNDLMEALDFDREWSDVTFTMGSKHYR